MLNRRHLVQYAVARGACLTPACAVLVPATAIAAEPGVSSNEIVIGNSSVLSGPISDVVKAYLTAAQLAFSAQDAFALMW